MAESATERDVESFLESTEFSGYQSMPLPGGRKLPGKLQNARADYILGDRVQNKTVLDVGTYYGFFAFAALERGARSATGLEPDHARAAVAAEVARLNGSRYTIVEGSLDSFQPASRFDVVLFLRVLHHVADPVRVMTQLTALAEQLLIVEFALVDDPQYLRNVYAGAQRAHPWDSARALITAWLLRAAAKNLPLVGVGNRRYDRTFYFSRAAFYNLFVTHLGLFSEVEFLPGSASSRRHALALCTPRRRDDTRGSY